MNPEGDDPVTYCVESVRENVLCLSQGVFIFYSPKGKIVDLVDLVDLVDSINSINKTLLIELIQLNPLSQRKTSAHPSILLYNKTIEMIC